MMKQKMRVIFNIFERLCVVTDVLADVWVEKNCIGVLLGEFVINVRADVIIDVASDIGVEMLTDDVNADVLVAAMTALGFVVSPP